MGADSAMKREKINIVWMRATVLFMSIVMLLTLFSTFVGIYFGSKSIARTVEEDLTFFSRMSSSMIESSIARLVTDCAYVTNKLDQAYLEGFSYVDDNGQSIHLPPGSEALHVAASVETKIGAQFFHVAAWVPERGAWIEAAKDEQYAYALLGQTDSEAYRTTALPFNPADPASTIVFGIPDQTQNGPAVLRSYTYRESGLLYVLTISGETYSAFVDADNLQLYGEGRVVLLDKSGFVFITTSLDDAGSATRTGQFYDRASEPVFWNHVLQSIEKGRQYMAGTDTEKTIDFIEYESAANGESVFVASAPIAVGNHCISFITTVGASATPLADIRSIFYVFAAAFSALGLLSSILFGYMQSRPYAQILKLKNMAEDASRVKSNFLSNMSHEIRTPLNAVIGMAEIAQNSADATRKDYCLSKISSSSKYLMGIINDILDMSKIEADKLELYAQPVLPSMILEKIKDVFYFRCQEKDIELRLNAPAMPQYIVSDEQRILQVIANLVSNAIKFTPEGGCVTLDARVAGEVSKDEPVIVEFSVTDTGIGISDAGQKNLFQAFQQADNSISARYGGTGLGLAISKRIVGLLGGDITVKSCLGEGSMFTVTIQAMLCDAPEAADVAKDTPPKLNYQGKTLLLAEDILINREIIAAILEDTGIRIIEAENGAEAVAQFEESAAEIDVVFMDLQMPLLDGYEATRRIRALAAARAKTVPIIAMTANVFKDDIDKCFDAGMNGHLGKPIDTTALRALLSKLLTGDTTA